MEHTPLKHQHCIVRAEVDQPLTDPRAVCSWISSLIKQLNMKAMYGPVAKYCSKKGNRGVTGFAIIETSHIAIHVWDECQPSLVQLDVYTCGEFEPNLVLEPLEQMKPVRVEYKWLDRETELVEVTQ